MKNYSQVFEKLGKERAKMDELMANYTTFRIGGPADLFYEAKTKRELVESIKLARRLKIPYFILGGGSNILVSDRGIRGLVIKIKNSEFRIQNSRVVAEAGVSLPWLVKETAKKGLAGLEFCAGIPGTVGGAIVGNAGTRSEWIGNLVKEVEILSEQGRIKKISGKDCQFGYRESQFSHNKEVVLTVVLKLSKDNLENIRKRMKEYLKKRENQPKEPSTGSIFKNSPHESAGGLIDQVGLKGYQIGRAQISEKHANFIVNLGGASCQDVLELISLAKETIKEKFGIVLEEEIKIVGEF